MSKQPEKQPRVVVAMSGGVDSSVAAALMVEAGYDVIGMMMRLWSETGKEALNRCCTPEQLADARYIAGQLGIPFYVADVKDHFRQTIVQFYMDEHRHGRTPNPCIECNRQIRFRYLYDKAMSLGADYLATGHYAQNIATPNGYELHQGVDSHKDQSYVLHMLTQTQLAHVKFPVGGYTKVTVRQLAEERKLLTAKKSDSMDLCFLSGDDYRHFLRRHQPETFTAGPIYSLDGTLLGEHTGLTNYTIGQRKGLGVSAPEPLFVVRKEAARNALILGKRTDVGQESLSLREVCWVAGEAPTGTVEVGVKIRYKAKPVTAWVRATGAGRAEVRFADPAFAPTAGQAAVFYVGTRCLGGGIITDAIAEKAIPVAVPIRQVEKA